MLTRPLLLSLSALFVIGLPLISAIAATASGQAKASNTSLVLEEFFSGRTIGHGTFESGIAGVERDFVVTTNGHWDGKVLTLIEDFRYDDGETDRKTWRFTKIGEGQYTGTREDVVGKAKVAAENGRVRMAYDIDLPRDNGRTTRLHFSDILEYQPDGSVLNTARVTKFAFPVGRVEVVFEKQ